MKPYNIHSTASGFRVTGFDEALNVEKAYIIVKNDGRQGHSSIYQCSCPAGHRPDCKHRKMLAMYQREGRIDTEWFLDWDTQQWQRLVASSEGSIEHEQAIEALSAEPAPAIVREPITTEQLDVAQFGRVLHERPTGPLGIRRRF